MSDNEQRVALVTGASRGIGAAVAARLARDGFRVAGTATSQGGAESIAASLGALGGAGFVLDVASPGAVADTLKAISEQFAAPLVLVNNAGITRDNILLRLRDEDWDAVLDTNLGGVFRLSKACLRGMTKARWGRIVNITSVVGSMGNAGQSNYAASKAGTEGFTRSLAREVGARNVTVNSIAPGFIDTDMTRALGDEQRTGLESQIPLGRLGHVDDIAAAVSFLCSDEASYITGETLHVNGGMYMG